MSGASRTTAGLALGLLADAGWAEPRRRSRFVARMPAARQQSLAPSAQGLEGLAGASIAGPADEVLRALERATARLAPFLMGDGLVRGGLPELRAMIAEWYSSRGLTTRAGQIYITSGAMGAFGSLLDNTPGTVALEVPTYHGAIQQLRTRRRHMVGWRRSPDWDFTALQSLLSGSRVSLAYLVPDFHNPTGWLASEAERIDLARTIGGRHVVVDETLRWLPLDSGFMPPHTAQVLESAVTIDGLSKAVWSGLRVGWARLPIGAGSEAYASALSMTACPVIDQLVAIELWPNLDEVVLVRRQRLREQRDALIATLRGSGFEVEAPPGGLVCWLDLGAPIAETVTKAMHAEGFPAAPGPRFTFDGSHSHHIRLPFTMTINEAERSAFAVTRIASGLR